MVRLFLGLCVATALLAPGTGTAQATDRAAPARAAPQPVDINSASRKALKTLPGIGDAEAERIIAARPYPSKAKLVADKVLSPEAYAALKGRIVAVQKLPPKTPASSRKDTQAGAKP
jgi:competence protein ComEA